MDIYAIPIYAVIEDKVADVVSATNGTSATSLLVVVACTTCVYLSVTLLLRIFGRRQLGQLTVLDLVVVLLIGSAVETAMIHGDLSLLAGLTSAATLLILNRAMTFTFLHSARFSHLVNGGPILLVHNGRVIEEHLRRVGLTRDDLDEGLRSRGYSDTGNVREAVLETDGSISVIDDTNPKH
jgi:uncharacterized membrane protein YcaP (DUF421 family)